MAPRSRRRAWLAGAALLALAPASQAAPFHAAKPQRVARPPKPPPEKDGLAPKEVYLEADELADDRDAKLVTGTGHVEARVDGRTVRADQIVYHSDTGQVHAHGHVSIVQGDGTTEYADDADLDDELRAGVALGFSARLQDNVVIAAGAAVRRNADVVELKSAIYTPCSICQADGVTPKLPTFSIQAAHITQDREHRIIYFRDAIIRVKGIPVAYAPFFAAPDPTADRASGFLAPHIGYDRRRGASWRQPYYWAISDSQDLTTSLQVNSSVNPLLEAEYRQRFGAGYIDVRGGYTYEKLFDNHGRYGEAAHRSFILGSGRLNLDQDWDAGFGAERVTDPTFFRRYGVRGVFENRGLYPADTDRLVSQAFVQRTDPVSYLSVATLSFQSLRVFGQDALGRPTFESNKGFPIVGPLIEARYDPPTSIFGGRLRIRGNGVVLSRGDDVISISDPTGLQPLGPQRLLSQLSTPLAAGASALSYSDSRRASVRGDWRRDFTFANGVRFTPLLQARGDLYSVSDAQLTTSNGLVNTTRAADTTTTIAQGTAGFTASWPFIRNAGSSSLILEPVVQALVSPRFRPDRNVPNEDSVAFEFDETTLFTADRFPGFDLYESGARFNVGGRANWLWGAGHSATATIGRVFRTDPDPAFTLGSGLQGRSSDWVATATIQPVTGVSFFVRTRLDSDTLHVRRDEAGLDVGYRRLQASFRYLYNESGFAIDTNGVTRIGRVEDATIAGSYFFNDHWGFSFTATHDLQQKITPYAQLGLIYRDDCIRVDVLYTRDETFRAAIGASSNITVRLTLATLGDTASPFKPRFSR